MEEDKPQQKQMSRGIAVALVITAIVGTGLYLNNEARQRSGDPYAECYNFLGMEDDGCSAMIAARHLMSLPIH